MPIVPDMKMARPHPSLSRYAQHAAQAKPIATVIAA